MVVLDISRLTVLADYFVIASGRSELQVEALYNELHDNLAQKGIHPKHLDQSKRWIVMDYGDIIVHIFHHEERSFYDLERLWADARRLSSNAD